MIQVFPVRLDSGTCMSIKPVLIDGGGMGGIKPTSRLHDNRAIPADRDPGNAISRSLLTGLSFSI